MTQQKIKWDDAYSLGIKNIDDQHKKLFDIVDKIFSLQESKDVIVHLETIWE